VSALQSAGVVKLNTVKRDLRGVVAVQQEMRAKKAEEGQHADAAAAGGAE